MAKMDVAGFLKYGAYVLVLAVYGVFAWAGKASVEAFLALLTAMISAHGATHIARVSRDQADRSRDVSAKAEPKPALIAGSQAGFANPLLLGLISIVGVAILLCGCASPGQASIIVQTPQQIAEQACPPVQAAITTLQGLADLPQGAQADLALVATLTSAVCAVGAMPSASSLQTLEKNALPTLLNVVKLSSLAVEDQNRITLGIATAQIVLSATENIADQATSKTNAISPTATPSAAATPTP